jgi:hypothetical protein
VLFGRTGLLYNYAWPGLKAFASAVVALQSLTDSWLIAQFSKSFGLPFWILFDLDV